MSAEAARLAQLAVKFDKEGNHEQAVKFYQVSALTSCSFVSLG